MRTTKMVKPNFFYILAFTILFNLSNVFSQDDSLKLIDRLSLDNLRTMDSTLSPYFPRWSICEPNLQLKVYQVFKLEGKNVNKEDMKNIVVTTSPINRAEGELVGSILLIECGKYERMTSNVIDAKMSNLKTLIASKKYCYNDIPIAIPPSQAQVEAITNFLEMPTNVTHSFSLSAFEQTLKLGKESGYWIRSIVGTEGAGYTFISSGEAKVQIHHPLYVNDNPNISEAKRKAIPNLLNFHIGMGYRLQDTSNGALSFLPQRQLNASYGGKGIFGFDFHFPTDPDFGVTFHVEVPMQGIDSLKTIERGTYSAYFKENPNNPRDPLVVAPLLRITGNTGIFYNWWLEEGKYENYLRFDLGINYTEVREAQIVEKSKESGIFNLNDRTEGLRFYHPTEFLDWLYAKVEYRNQSTFPFGLSAQYSNQYFLGRVYLPLVGNWLYLDARYSIPLRTENRPFDKAIFMISPVLRLNI
jgi:hypothetical protein